MNSQIFLNVAAWTESTTLLGPGKRFALWLQGCPFNCPGCVAPGFIPPTGGYALPVRELTAGILSVEDIQGITVSGGEPILQAEALAGLLSLLCEQTGFSIIMYSGYTLEELDKIRHTRPAVGEVLNLLDVLIDGRYRHELNNSTGLRGSTNQRVHFLTRRYAHLREVFYDAPRTIETRDFMADSKLMVGLPTRAQWVRVNGGEAPGVWYDGLMS